LSITTVVKVCIGARTGEIAAGLPGLGGRSPAVAPSLSASPSALLLSDVAGAARREAFRRNGVRQMGIWTPMLMLMERSTGRAKYSAGFAALCAMVRNSRVCQAGMLASGGRRW